MIDIIAKYPNIMKFIHLPVQSGNDRVLKAMGRRYTREQYLNLVKEMREKIPGLSLSTDIIVGFPNETEEEFKDTLSLVDIVKYEAAFTFIYSPRKGTPAAKIEDNISKEDKTRRFLELVKHLEVHIEEHSKSLVGQTFDVLVDGPSKTDKEMYSGYTEENKLVHFKGCPELIGKIIKVKIGIETQNAIRKLNIVNLGIKNKNKPYKFISFILNVNKKKEMKSLDLVFDNTNSARKWFYGLYYFFQREKMPYKICSCTKYVLKKIKSKMMNKLKMDMSEINKISFAKCSNRYFKSKSDMKI
jgi:hypothetical protein